MTNERMSRGVVLASLRAAKPRRRRSGVPLDTSAPLRSSLLCQRFSSVSQALLLAAGTGGVPGCIGRAELVPVGALQVRNSAAVAFVHHLPSRPHDTSA